MDALTLHRSSSSMFGVSSSVSGFDFPTVKRPHFVQFGVRFGFSKGHSSVCTMKPGNRRVVSGSRRGMVVRSSLSSEPEESSGPIAPLQLESPVGQFLSQILMSHPHLVPAAADKQLEQLQIDRDTEKQQDGPSAPGTDLVLYRRIAKIKANERKTALEEILYALVVQKFMDSSVSLVPTITPDPSGHVATWPSQDKQLEQLHSTEAYEMIQNHLALILGNRISDSTSVAQISKVRAGQVYAASVMYGYFLKRVDQRFQLEKTMKNLPHVSPEEEEYNVQQALGEEIRPSGAQSKVSTTPFSGMGPDGFNQKVKNSRLRTYVMSFDGDTLQRYATIRSKEAVSIIEKHTEALFGRPEIAITPQGTIDSSQDELIKISFGGLKRLVLEAVTFGSFLWEVESYVDSRYHFVAS